MSFCCLFLVVRCATATHRPYRPTHHSLYLSHSLSRSLSHTHTTHKDQLPPCPPSYVHTLVAAEFRKPFAALFSAFDPLPLASASVAQVHRATLATLPAYLKTAAGSGEGGEEEGKKRRDVVVKVQHRGIAALMASDMIAAARVFRVVAWLNSDFELLLRLLEAWAEEIERELDFRVNIY